VDTTMLKQTHVIK